MDVPAFLYSLSRILHRNQRLPDPLSPRLLILFLGPASHQRKKTSQKEFKIGTKRFVTLNNFLGGGKVKAIEIDNRHRGSIRVYEVARVTGGEKLEFLSKETRSQHS